MCSKFRCRYAKDEIAKRSPLAAFRAVLEMRLAARHIAILTALSRRTRNGLAVEAPRWAKAEAKAGEDPAL